MATLERLSCALKQTQAKDICAPSAVLDMAREWKGMGENLFNSLVDCFSDIESREKALNSVRESVEKRLKDLEKREREFDLFQEGKKEELELREEKLDEQLKLVGEHIERMEREVDGLRLRNCKELKEFEKREREVEFTRASWEKRLREVEKREKDFEAFRNGKLKELDLIEEVLGMKKKEFVEEVKLTNEKLREKQKIGYGLIERLEESLNMLEGMKVVIDKRFEEINSWETAAHESLTGKLNEADLIRESLEKRFQEFEEIEKTHGLLQESITQELVSKKGQLGTVKMVLLEDIELREAKPTEQQTFGKQLSEYLENTVAKKLKEIDSDEELIVNVACEALDASAKRADLSRESVNKPLEEHGTRDERKIREIDPHVHFTIDPHTSVDSKHALEKDEETLEWLINNISKDLELMDDEIFKILLLSSDPAKFVLDAVERFNAGSKEFKVRRVTILLLDQLTKMSPNIQPCVTEAAIKLAREWKSKLCTTAEDPLEVLGFLHVLAAYNLSSNFDKNELSSFVKLVAQHKQTAELCRILGLADKIHGFIQSLINEKQYLLASTYIYECELEHRFPQAAVLNYYVKHAKLSAKVKCRRERRSSAAQGRSIDSEIADLRVAIEHINKYGLESEYSPDVLTARIKQLERNRANWRCRSPASLVGVQKQGKNKRRWDANKRNNGPMTQMSQQGSECWSSSPSWKAQNRKIKTERHSPIAFHKRGDVAVVDDHPSSAHKRRRRDLWFHDG